MENQVPYSNVFRVYLGYLEHGSEFILKRNIVLRWLDVGDVEINVRDEVRLVPLMAVPRRNKNVSWM